MMGKWKRIPIVDLCETHVDCVNRTAPAVDGPTPFKMIRTTNVRNGFIDVNNVKYVDEPTYHRWTRRLVPIKNDVILTREAPLGNIGIVRSDDAIFLGQRLYHFRSDREKLNPYFLLYSLLADDLQGQIKGFGSGSTVEHMRLGDIPLLKVNAPSIETQKKIAAILSAYDDLIENNLRRIKILEEMARNLYHEWFVKFRFPGHQQVRMIDSPLGEIPEGWEVAQLKEIADVNAISIRKGNAPEEIVYVDIASVSPGSIDKMETMRFTDAPSRARRVAKHGDIVWSSVRPNRRSFSLIVKPPQNLIVSTGFAVISPKQIPYTFLYQSITTDYFVVYLVNHAKGAAYPAVNIDDFANASIVLPNSELLEKFDQVVQEITIPFA
ncbi:MAG TPA: restriction endonuclease subunit S, partial [Desulfobacterales bacterium]|nr:restriction endonuclease subunit S [Desulfobacterales bacterium]